MDGLTTSSNGLEYPSQSVFSTQKTEARGEPWCPCQWPPTLSHEDGPRQGKARQGQTCCQSVYQI